MPTESTIGPLENDTASGTEFLLWPQGVPGALGTSRNDLPTLTPYLPESGKRTGAAIVVLPGGGYGELAPHEGVPFAEWLNKSGITAFVLKYRLGTHGYRHPAMLQDGARAIRTVRATAAQWQIDPNRVGIMGSSAGGHLAATVLTHFDAGKQDASDPIERVSCRPDLGILCYPLITMGLGTHEGSLANLLGPHPSAELVDNLSNEKQVRTDTPPCFILHTAEDAVVKAINPLGFASSLAAHGVPFALHIYEKGAHGIGLGKDATDATKLHPWTADCLYWLKGRDFLSGQP
jgi:acetyl esterase/lipase